MGAQWKAKGKAQAADEVWSALVMGRRAGSKDSIIASLAFFTQRGGGTGADSVELSF